MELTLLSHLCFAAVVFVLCMLLTMQHCGGNAVCGRSTPLLGFCMAIATSLQDHSRSTGVLCALGDHSFHIDTARP